jgi:hypothetical protein
LISNRILYRDGVPILAREAGEVRALTPDLEQTPELVLALVRKRTTAQLRTYLGMTGVPAASVSLNRPPGRRRTRRTKTITTEG